MLQGNTKNLPLQNIFQTLALNQQEGILTVTHQQLERHIAIHKNGVSLLCDRPFSSKILQKVTARLKILTPSEYENIFTTTAVQAAPGDALIQCQVLAPGQVIDALREQFLEFIYEIFEWRDASYRFEVREMGPERVIFTHPELRRRLEFPVNAVLMEVVRREDEWNRIRELIPSAYQIYQFVPGGGDREIPSAVNMDPQRLRTLYDLIDGERALEEIVEASRIPPFFVFSTLRVLIEEGRLRPITLADKKKLTERLRQKFQLERVAIIYMSILDEAPEEVDVRRKLVIYLERKKAPIAELIPHYRKLAVAAYQQGDGATCQQYLERILEQEELDVDAAELMALVQLQSGKDKSWQQATRAYIGIVRRTRQFDRGAAFLLQVAAARKAEGWLIQEAAHLYLLGGNPQSAAAHYEKAARIFQSNGDLRSLGQCVEKLEVCDAQAASRWTRLLQATSGSGERSRGRVGLIAGCALVAGVIGYGIYESDARITYSEVFAAANSYAAYGDVKRAQQLLREFDKDHRWSLVAHQIPSDLVHLERVASKHATESALEHLGQNSHKLEVEDVEQLVSKGTTFKRRGEYKVALEYYKAIDTDKLPSQLAQMVRDEVAYLSGYLRDADELAREGHAKEQAGKLEDASAIYLKILNSYPYSPVVEDLRLPLVLDIHPPEAVVLADTQRLSGPPFILRVVPGHEPVVSVSAATFAAKVTTVDPRQGYLAMIHLSKQALWKKALSVLVESEPLRIDDHLFLGTRSGSVLCLDAESGEEYWLFKLAEAGDCLGGVRRHEDSVIFTGTDRALYRVRIADGSLVYRLPRIGFARAPLTDPDRQARTFLVTAQERVAALDVGAGKVLWERGAPGGGEFPALVAGDRVFVTARSGKISALDAGSGERVWFAEHPAAITAPPIVIGDLLVATLEDGSVAAVGTADGERRWVRSIGAPLAGATPAVASGGLAVLGSRGLLRLLRAVDGGDLWQTKLDGSFAHTPVATAGHLITVSDDGVVRVSAQTDGKKLWSYDIGTQASAPLHAPGSTVYVAGIDRTLHAITIEPRH